MNKIILFTFLILAIYLGIFWGTYHFEAKDARERVYKESLNECDRADYDTEHAWTVYQKTNALLAKQNLILERKCK